MSETKKRMLKNMHQTVVFSILALALALAGMINAIGGQQQQIDKRAQDGEKCFIDVQLLYGPFDGEGQKGGFYVAVDSRLDFYVVRLGNSEIKKCEAIIEYVKNGGNGQIPETVRIAGVMRSFDNETRDGAVQEFNKLLGRPVTNEANASVFLGSAYLDAVSYIDIAWYVNFVPSVVCVIFAGIFLSRHYKYVKLAEPDREDIKTEQN